MSLSSFLKFVESLRKDIIQICDEAKISEATLIPQENVLNVV